MDFEYLCRILTQPNWYSTTETFTLDYCNHAADEAPFVAKQEELQKWPGKLFTNNIIYRSYNTITTNYDTTISHIKTNDNIKQTMPWMWVK